MAEFALLHGFAQTPHTWDEVAGLLREHGHHAHALDLVSCAKRHAGKRSLSATCDAVAHEVRRISDTASTPLVLVGYSMGGRVALEMLVREMLVRQSAPPAHGRAHVPLAGLVLESAGLGPLDESARQALASRNAQWARDVERRGVDAFMSWWEQLPLFASQRALPSETQARVRAERTSRPAEELAWQLEELGQHHQSDEATSLAALERAAAHEMPVLYIAGELDRKYAEVARRIGSAAPHVSTAAVRGAGHNTHLERADAFVDALISAFPV